jgi:intein-encoded DNA endonuclease-like protein
MKLYHDKEWLSIKYKEFKSPTKISEYLLEATGQKVSPKTISYWRHKLDIPKLDTSQSARKHFFNQEFFENIDTEEKAYWLGFIMADGCVYKGSDKYSYRLQINLSSSDESHLDKFQKAIGSKYKYQRKERTDKWLKEITSMSHLKVNSTKMCEDLIKFGIVISKTGSESMPKLNDSLLPHFIRGFFDGDGSVKLDRLGRLRFSIVSSSLDILKDMQSFLERKTGAKSSIYTRKSKPNHLTASPIQLYDLEASGQNAQLIYGCIYKNPSIYLERKYEKIINNKDVPYRSNSVDKTV